MGTNATVNLQATLSATTAGTGEGQVLILPHHPLVCGAGIYFDEEGDFSCDHAKAPHKDRRTQAALNHSLAILIVELASKL